MDEDTAIINSNNRNERIKNFLLNNKKILVITILTVIILLISYFSISELKERKKIKISDTYNSIVNEYSKDNKEITKNGLLQLIDINDETYSPLSLYFIIDNQLISDNSKINDLFNKIIKNAAVSKEIKNLIIYKKALYNADNVDENELLEILKPIINSNSVWKSHALYLMGEYFYSRNENQKSKEFFNELILLDNANQNLKIESQKRLNRDLSG